MNNYNQQFFSGYFNGQPFGQGQEMMFNPMSPEEAYNTMIYNVSNNMEFCKEVLYYVNSHQIKRDDKKQYEYYEKDGKRKIINQFDAQLILFILDNHIIIDNDMTDEIFLQKYLKPYIIPNYNPSTTDTSTNIDTSTLIPTEINSSTN